MSAEAQVHILLLRGINVGGANPLPMARLRQMLAGIGLTRPETLIASGNAVFESEASAATLVPQIAGAIAAEFGFAPALFIRSLPDLRAARALAAFPGAAPDRVHVFFLSRPAGPLDDAGLRALAAEGDAWRADGNLLALHVPAGIGRSRLANRLDRFLPEGIEVTARNLQTVTRLIAMAEARITQP